MSEGDKVYLGGLWRHESNNGRVYYSGTFGAAKLLLFEDSHTEGDGPQLKLYLAPRTERRDGQAQRQTDRPRNERRPAESCRVEPASDDDIPF